MNKVLFDAAAALDALKVETAALQTRLSEVDAKISALYHILELGNLNAAQIMKVGVKLRAALQERRNLKEDSAQALTILSAKAGEALSLAELEKRRAERLKKYIAESKQAMIDLKIDLKIVEKK